MTTGVSLLDQYGLLFQNVEEVNRLPYREQMAKLYDYKDWKSTEINDKMHIMARSNLLLTVI
jgi:hypothetical protein